MHMPADASMPAATHIGGIVNQLISIEQTYMTSVKCLLWVYRLASTPQVQTDITS